MSALAPKSGHGSAPLQCPLCAKSHKPFVPHSCRRSHCSFTVRGQRGESYGEEKEGQEENQVLKLQARASYWRGTFGFRGVIDLAKRLNEVRPLLL
jgi:hypothetical protein